MNRLGLFPSMILVADHIDHRIGIGIDEKPNFVVAHRLACACSELSFDIRQRRANVIFGERLLDEKHVLRRFIARQCARILSAFLGVKKTTRWTGPPGDDLFEFSHIDDLEVCPTLWTRLVASVDWH